MKKAGSTSSKNEFTKLLLRWNRDINTRKMPWKGEKDPYKVWLSEIILQQTRVEQGLPYYEKFIGEYPTITHLANAREEEVFKKGHRPISIKFEVISNKLINLKIIRVEGREESKGGK